MPLIPLIETDSYYQTETPLQYVLGKTKDVFELPDRINTFIEGFLSLSEEDKASFLSCCFLFEQAFDLFWQAPSLAFAASVSAIETLIAVDHRGEGSERCDCCGQEKFGVRQKFLHFMKTYGSDSAEMKKYADKIYERRSKALHEGQLIPGEVDPRTIEGAIEWLADDDSRRKVIMSFRACIINWLIVNTRIGKKAL